MLGLLPGLQLATSLGELLTGTSFCVQVQLLHSQQTDVLPCGFIACSGKSMQCASSVVDLVNMDMEIGTPCAAMQQYSERDFLSVIF